MAIVIENGSIVTGANSYVSVQEITDYAALRCVTLTGNVENILHKAMDYLEGQNFKGSKSTKEQPLQWPREDVYIDGFEIENNEIPNELKNAQLAIALEIAQSKNPFDDSQLVKMEKVGPLETEYFEKNGKKADSISLSLKKLTVDSIGMAVHT